ncbi:MAG: hypothetical protein IPN03_18585 [Holophagales bacterium]|nr:hypothetical protein [Holophagales bacterium]
MLSTLQVRANSADRRVVSNYVQRTFALVSLVTLALFTSACARANALVTVQNASPETIQNATIVVSGEEIQIRALKPNESTTRKYTIGVESDFAVRVVFADGRTLVRNVGYADAGLNTHDYLTISADDVTYSSTLEGSSQSER